MTPMHTTNMLTSILHVSIGDVLADSIDNSINEDSLAALIRMPGGCVEQNLASITLPLIAAHYLDRSSQWESVGINRREEAIKYIQRGERDMCTRIESMFYSYPFTKKCSSNLRLWKPAQLSKIGWFIPTLPQWRHKHMVFISTQVIASWFQAFLNSFWYCFSFRITAYVMKVFSMANSYIIVSEKHLCGPLLYLLNNKQQPDGSFKEDNPVYTPSMTVRI